MYWITSLLARCSYEILCFFLFLQVAVKCRPLTDNERRRSRHIIQVIDDKVNRGSLVWFRLGE